MYFSNMKNTDISCKYLRIKKKDWNQPRKHQKWLYQNLGGITLKNVQFDPQTTEMWQKQSLCVTT